MEDATRAFTEIIDLTWQKNDQLVATATDSQANIVSLSSGHARVDESVARLRPYDTSPQMTHGSWNLSMELVASCVSWELPQPMRFAERPRVNSYPYRYGRVCHGRRP